jgi:hypothetical protein
MTGIHQGLEAAHSSQRDDLHFAMLAAKDRCPQPHHRAGLNGTMRHEQRTRGAHVSPSRLGNQKTPILLAIRRQKRVAP